MIVKVKTWIEDDSENLIFGSGKTQILELIHQTGSIMEASKKVGMNYKKAWTHIKILQKNIEDDLVIASKGRTSGGTKLTPKAQEMIENYKILQDEVEEFTKKRFKELFQDGKEMVQCSDEMGDADAQTK
jgi:molybdate transport system regulatory protein